MEDKCLILANGKSFTILILFMLSSCYGQNVLDGKWEMTEGKISPSPGMFDNDKIRKKSWVEFSGDTITSSLGFFYYIVKDGDDLPTDKYPFVYYGDSEKFYTRNDSLYIWRRPLNRYDNYKISWIDPQKFILISSRFGNITLQRKFPSVDDRVCHIQCIKTEVYSGEFTNLHYQITLTQGDSLFYRALDYHTDSIKGSQKYKMPTGYFKKICKRFSAVDLWNIHPIYPQSQTEIISVELMLYMDNGNTVHTVMEGGNGPELLRLACIPVIYSYHLVKYKDVIPVE